MPIKVLQFFPHPLSPRSGGAYTYLYNLQKEIKNDQEMQIFFLNELVNFDDAEQKQPGSYPYLKKIIKKIAPKKWINKRRVSGFLKSMKKTTGNELKNVDLNEFDILHFHEAIDLWKFDHLLAGYKGKILFTPHSPVPYHLEMLEEVFGLKRNDIPVALCNKLEEIDIKAFSMAQQFVFPCKEALDAYFRTWKGFDQLITEKPVHYLVTGVPPAMAQKTKTEILANYSIPQQSFVISYTGRHSDIKGYDILQKIAKELLPIYDNIYFLVAGKKSDNETFQHPRFIQVGWTDDPFSIINAADVHIIPNRETYFDLNTLEVMSLEKPVILTETGGNRFLKKNTNSPGLIFTSVAEREISEKIEECYRQKSSLPVLGRENKLIYEKFYGAELFAQRYIELYKNL